MNIDLMIDNISDHIKLISMEYKLNNLYIIYNTILWITYISKESFYWTVILFSNVLSTMNKEQANNEKFKKAGFIIAIMISLVPLESYLGYYRQLYIKALKDSSSIFFYKRLLNMNKLDQVRVDLLVYENHIEHLNEYIEAFVLNNEMLATIPLRILSLVVMSYVKDLKGILYCCTVYIAILEIINKNKIQQEIADIDNQLKLEKIIKNFISSSKRLIINNELNLDTLKNLVHQSTTSNMNIGLLNNSMNTKTNILTLIYIFIVMRLNIDKFEPSNFLFYFLITYDVELITDKLTDYYKRLVGIYKIKSRLQYLYKFKQKYQVAISLTSLLDNGIHIKYLFNDKPYVYAKNIIVTKENPLLINGKSGSGKTSILYILKGIIKPIISDITPPLSFIHSRTYLTFANSKIFHNEKLYNIISNYDNDLDLIQYCINIARVHVTTNEDIYLDKISNGERIRILIASMIYSVIKNKYEVILIDEIDENLDSELAITICKDILQIFKDKIIFYISHNEDVKKLFKNKFICEKKRKQVSV